MEREVTLPHSQGCAIFHRLYRMINSSQSPWEMFNVLSFYVEEMSVPRPGPNLEDHHLSAVRDSLFNTFTASFLIRRPFLHPQPEDAPCCGDRDPLSRPEQVKTNYCQREATSVAGFSTSAAKGKFSVFLKVFTSDSHPT
jgi:hypothetical protein